MSENKKMKQKKPGGLRRYRMFLGLLAIEALVLLLRPELGTASLELSWKSLLEMLSVLPPILILLGLLDVWVKRETFVKYMGDDSGLTGILIAYFLGSVAAGPLYAAFPVAVVLIRKGARLLNVFVLLGAWSTTKIPLLLFEATSMGIRFTLIRLALSLVGIAVIAILSEKLLTHRHREEIRNRVASLD